MKGKIILLILQIVQNDRVGAQIMEKYSFLTAMKFPFACNLPVYECRKYCYFLTFILHQYQAFLPPDLRTTIIKLIIDLIYYL
jgi:hypothetical protein